MGCLAQVPCTFLINGVNKTDEDANNYDDEKRPLLLLPMSSEIL